MGDAATLRGPVTRALARLFVKGWDNPSSPQVATRLGLLALSVTVTVNLLLFAFKIGFGLRVGSLALIADALDTLGDVLLDAVGLIALTVSLRGPDREHPYGHERAEEIASIIVATVLVLIGIQFGYSAAQRLVSREYGDAFAWGAVAAALVSVVLKFAIGSFAANLAHYTGSPLLKVSAWHYFTDVASGLLAAVALLARRYGYGILDPLFGLFIALIIVVVAVRIMKEAGNSLVGRGGDAQLLEQIHLTTCSQPGVLGCSDIEVHWYGRKKRVSMRIQVADAKTLREGHEIAERVQRELHGLHADWEPVVHVDPVRVEEARGGHTADRITE